MEHKAGEKLEPKVNYYVLAGIFTATLFFMLANSFENDVEPQMDFFEIIFIAAYAAPSIFCFAIAKRYWPSKVFGRAYLALGVAYAATSIGAFIFDYLEIIRPGVYPYPSEADYFFAVFYPFAIYHLRTNIHFIRGSQKPELKRSQIMLLIAIPLVSTLIYAFGLPFITLEVIDSENAEHGMMLDLVPDVISQLRFGSVNHDLLIEKGFYTGLYFIPATTLTFSWAIIGAQVFRGSILGAPWGLLLIGIGLTTMADVSYYFYGISSYDRASPIIGIWVLGLMIVCYALYLHKKQI